MKNLSSARRQASVSPRPVRQDRLPDRIPLHPHRFAFSGIPLSELPDRYIIAGIRSLEGIAEYGALREALIVEASRRRLNEERLSAPHLNEGRCAQPGRANR